MSYEPLPVDLSTPYEKVAELLGYQQYLVATWLRTPTNTPNARYVGGRADYDSIVAKASGEDPYYIELKFFAAPSGLVCKYYDFVELPAGFPLDISPEIAQLLGVPFGSSDAPRPGQSLQAFLDDLGPALAVRPQPPSTYFPSDGTAWGDSFVLTLTKEWQEITPGVEALAARPGSLTYRLRDAQTEEWGPRLGAVQPNDWWEFTPGIQVRQSPTEPGRTEFRLKLKDE